MAHPELLAEAIRTRRAELGETVVSITEAAPVSRSTWMAIEAGRRSRVSFATLTAVDEALLWEPGTAFRIWNGETVARTPPTGDHTSGPFDHVATTASGTTVAVEMSAGAPNPIALSVAAQVAEMTDASDIRLVEQLVSRLTRYTPPSVDEVFRDVSRRDIEQMLELARRMSNTTDPDPEPDN